MLRQIEMTGSEKDNKATDLKVAQVIGRLSVGGAEKHFVSLLNEIRARDRLAVFTSPDVDGPSLEEQLDSSITVVRCPVRKRTAVRDVFRLAGVFRESGVDVVHTHMFWPSLYGVLAARIARVPVIVTTEHGENKWKKRRHRLMERYGISRFAQRRFCVSESILKNRRDIDGVPADLLALTANGTPVPDEPARLRTSAGPLIGTVGRVVPQKNYRAFVDTIFEVRSRGYEVSGCIVGDGPLLDDIHEHIARRGLSDVVETPGMVQDVGSWYRRFDIYLISSDQEGQPVSLLEAMSYGLPIVSTDVGAIAKTMRHGVDGLIAEAGNVSGLADAVCRYLDDRSLAESCAASARERVIRDYSIDAIARHYEDAYKELFDERSKAA